MKSFATVTTLVLAGLMLVGCSNENRGVETDVPIESRRPTEGALLASKDLAAATEMAVESIAQVPELRGQDRTVIVMDQVFNETRDRSTDFQIFLARIRAMLNQSGLKQDIVFVESRNKAEAILQREGYPQTQTARTLPQYALTATFSDLVRGRSNYYLLTFQLFNMRSQELLWEDFYEVKLEWEKD
jgi:PBP1b-binding outer membrane lipoprotein LpoB